MEITTIIGVGIIGTVLAVTVKNYRPEIGLCISLATGILIFSKVARWLGDITLKMVEICENAGIDKGFFGASVKVICIAYVTQFASELAKDAGEGAIAKKLELAGKTLVLVSVVPVIENLLGVIIGTLAGF